MRKSYAMQKRFDASTAMRKEREAQAKQEAWLKRALKPVSIIRARLEFEARWEKLPTWLLKEQPALYGLLLGLKASGKDFQKGVFPQKAYKAFRAFYPELKLPTSPAFTGVAKALQEAGLGSKEAKPARGRGRQQPGQQAPAQKDVLWRKGCSDVDVKVYISNQVEDLIGITTRAGKWFTSCQRWDQDALVQACDAQALPLATRCFNLLEDPTVWVAYVAKEGSGEMRGRVLVRLLVNEEGENLVGLDQYYGDSGYEEPAIAAVKEFAAARGLRAVQMWGVGFTRYDESTCTDVALPAATSPAKRRFTFGSPYADVGEWKKGFLHVTYDEI